MANSMQERFLVRAPIGTVWEFLMDPRHVVPCMPGAHLDEVESDRAFTGSIKIAFGPFKTSYRGRVEFAEVDADGYRVRMVAEGHERGSGDATGSMVSYLKDLGDKTEVFVDASVEGASKLANQGLQFGENLAHELFAQFVANVKDQLEPVDPSRAIVPRKSSSVQVVPLVARAVARQFRAKRKGR